MNGPTILLYLVKIIGILLATIGLQISVTPPHPPPGKSDEAPSTSWEVVVKQRAGPVVIKLICWLAAIIEVTLISAQALGHETLAKCVLKMLGVYPHNDFGSGNQSSFELPLLYWSSAVLYPSPVFVLGASLAIVGGCIRYRCYRELGRLFTFEMSIMKEHRLIVSGPYAFVRHPAYTGLLCTLTGIVLIYSASGSWFVEYCALSSPLGLAIATCYLAITVTYMIGLLKRIPREDEALEDRFGPEWRSWAKRVPYRLLWGIY
ncbi:hypothetical protein D9757_004304 [Collybiopsis confluens]|uniref:Protein-S-isoprenylcysteine O-methyltransferase n=1 Tax=Collybiopsis confluens TaxID=2823264 RepID=A0A8H5MCJ9_9AGAR|nr:hypothetical protein D9757_004304 [Collybiopsis confluens]